VTRSASIITGLTGVAALILAGVCLVAASHAANLDHARHIAFFAFVGAVIAGMHFGFRLLFQHRRRTGPTGYLILGAITAVMFVAALFPPSWVQ